MVALTLLLGGRLGADAAIPPDAMTDADVLQWGHRAGVAWTLAGNGDLVAALESISDTIKACPANYPSRDLLICYAAGLELRLYRWSDAQQRIDAAFSDPTLEISPTYACRLRRLAVDAAIQSGRLELARQRLDELDGVVAAYRAEVTALGGPLDPDSEVVGFENSARLTRANWLIAMVQPAEAVRLLETWLTAMLESGDSSAILLADIYFNLGVAHAEFETAEEARTGRRAEVEYFQRAIEMCDSVEGMERLSARARLALARDALRHGELETARQFLDDVSDGAYRGVDRALRAALEGQWARLAAPVEPDCREDIDRELESAYDALCAEWERAGVHRGGIGWLHFYKDRALVAEWLSRVATKDDVESAFEAYAELQALSTLARRMNATAPTLADVRAALVAPDHGVLVYVPSVFTGSLVFAVSQETITLERVAPYHTVEPLRRAWTRRHAEAPGVDLAAHLLPPGIRAAMATWTRVTIVGLDGIHVDQLPFDGAPLGSAFAVDHWPSLPVGVMAAARGDRHDGAAALIAPAGVPIPPGVPPAERKAMKVLPTEPAVATARAIDGASRRNGRSHAIGSSATRDGLRTLAASKIDVLAFVGHAVTDWQLPEPALLVLADGCVDAEFVRRFDVAPRFVLLLGCRSGSERDLHGDPGATELAGAWLEAGAGAVLVTRTPISWHDGLDIATAINEAINRGASLTEAVRALRTSKDGARFDGVLEVVGAGQ